MNFVFKNSFKVMAAKFPQFAEYLDFTVDPYWCKIFENCSKGKFPKRSGFDETRGDFGSVWLRDKEMHWYRLLGESETDYLELKKLFKDYLKLKSIQDRSETRDQFNRLKKELDKSYTGDWKNIKRKNIRDSLIRQYILRLKGEYDLAVNDTIKLSKEIRQCILFGWITPDHIEYSGETRRIENITSLKYEDDVFIVEKAKTKCKREYTETKNSLAALWKKK
jgi:hypothetical protein